MKIMLDPGHGGDPRYGGDTGAVNGKHHESVYALDIVKRAGALCKARGLAVGYTRTKDIRVSIGARYNAANAWGADAFVSIHINSAQESACGAETLVYKIAGQSAELAAKVQAAVIDATGTKDRGVKPRPDLGVLKGTDMPAVLCEVGFISNTQECAKLATEGYRQTVAEAIARGVCAWAGITYEIEEDEDMVVYKTLADVPEWGKATIKKLMDKGLMTEVNVTEDMLRVLVISDRAGLYK